LKTWQLWFLRRFSAFRALEQRINQLTTHESGVEQGVRWSVARVEAELLHALCLHTSWNIDVDVLPTQRVGWLPPGQVRVRMFEGGGPS
jgi:hypothetical protein